MKLVAVALGALFEVVEIVADALGLVSFAARRIKRARRSWRSRGADPLAGNPQLAKEVRDLQAEIDRARSGRLY